ncbi:protein FAM162B-like [Scyliorhinus canicula]|uniref:protein FAM162B-like n=1 Tax=Scyliorhinus canicula TaxID=7830 RepID=UPI0018F44C78|nr:protein FAM162B-like [Scyliorhinus canicula]
MWRHWGVAAVGGLRLALRANRGRPRRWFGSKPEEGKCPAGSGSATPAKAGAGGHSAFKLPGYKPSTFDKKMLMWTGRFKRVEDIPPVVSFEMINTARNKMRVKVSYGMVIITILSCFATIISGKKAADRHESLSAINMAKKARWKKERQQEADVAKKE